MNDHQETLDLVQVAFRNFAVIATHLEDAQIERAVKAVSEAESIGFVLDPTAYRDALQTGSLRRQRELLALYQKTKSELRRIFPEGWRDS